MVSMRQSMVPLGSSEALLVREKFDLFTLPRVQTTKPRQMSGCHIFTTEGLLQFFVKSVTLQELVVLTQFQTLWSILLVLHC